MKHESENLIDKLLSPKIEIKITNDFLKKNGELPKYQSELAAGIDLYACVEETIEIKPGAIPALISTGIAIHMNKSNMMAIILPRSGLGHKKGLILGNTAGVIDADYSGTIFISAWNRNHKDSNMSIFINPGERIAQMIFLPIIKPIFDLVENFSENNPRGNSGFGSTGK
ncbi:dUTP pyrophosphatase [Candidatus Kinetoplastibacterium desouzaii TCC079E]|uniref:dUTP diphosphatase n=1 Tax=Candidatus Kinetoplastidibacterium desouzai TCC079E TaxID=1208919 RepID=M1LU24_9PROT|nr:dUTP diphosphatase [Candidatus Kinetoplastibacterium desouzaii]AGF46784.1 dUTP pyrophosphatase [Candidatus Kinetoplastibacterium desouzaii TCC079E]